jgi:uncharacterized protein involved in cysteine biosynthesis
MTNLPVPSVLGYLPPLGLGFRRGLPSALRALGFLARRPRLLALCAAPWAINLLIVLPGMFWLLDRLVADRVAALVPQWDGFLGGALAALVELMLFLWVGAISLGAMLVGALLLGAPFHDKVGERVEMERLARFPHLQADPVPFWSGVRHSLAEALKRVAVAVPFFLATWLLGLVPVVGVLLVGIAQVTFAATFLALDAFSMPFDRRGVKMPGKLEWIRGNAGFAVGFGLPFLVVPCAVFLAPPIAAVAASLVYCDEVLKAQDDGKDLEALARR